MDKYSTNRISQRDALAQKEGRYNEQICIIFVDPCLIESTPIAEVTVDYDYAAAERREAIRSYCRYSDEEYNFCEESYKDSITTLEEYWSCLGEALSGYNKTK